MKFSAMIKPNPSVIRNSIFSLLLTSSLVFIASCKPEEPVFCTMEFRSIAVQVNNDSIARAFVIDQKLKDTLSCKIWNNQCTIADDGEVFNRLNTGEKRNYTFHAVGKLGGKVTGDFKISRDQCHILLVSGPAVLSF